MDANRCEAFQHQEIFKPMARFHLPLSSELETIYRSSSMYLLAQYFSIKEGEKPDFELIGLANIYHNIQVVNMSMSKRLKAATKTDSTVNAVILLDMYAQTMPCVIEESLEDIRYLFAPLLKAYNNM